MTERKENPRKRVDPRKKGKTMHRGVDPLTKRQKMLLARLAYDLPHPDDFGLTDMETSEG